MKKFDKPNYICFFSNELSSLDCLSGQVIGKNETKLFIRAAVPHEPNTFVYGFAFWGTTNLVAIGTKVVVGLIKQFDDGDFRFRVDAISEVSSIVPIQLNNRIHTEPAVVA